SGVRSNNAPSSVRTTGRSSPGAPKRISCISPSSQGPGGKALRDQPVASCLGDVERIAGGLVELQDVVGDVPAGADRRGVVDTSLTDRGLQLAAYARAVLDVERVDPVDVRRDHGCGVLSCGVRPVDVDLEE